MANYNVGNIEIGAVSNTKTALSDLDQIISKLNGIKNASTTTSKATTQINDSVKNTKTSVDSLSKSIKSTINLGKIYFLFNYLKRLGQGLVQLVGYASDFTETLNKFQVSFGDLYEQNLEYVNKLATAYGFSKQTLMDYQSTFNNMLKSLEGLSDETSATLSQTLTRMAIDYASLFNVSIERSMRAFQSVLSGSIRPIREVSGFDVSETSIFQVYKDLGGTKTMRQLNQLEKRLLRIIAIQQQMEKVGAFGDYSKTIETVANQLKIFQEQMKEFGATWGRLVLVKFKPVLQYLNGIIIALNELGALITKNISLTDGIDMDQEFAGLETNIADADQAVQELNESLTQLGLDQLNIIGGTGSVSTNLGVSQEILDALGKYQDQLDDVNFKAREISKEILKWFGYQYNANGELEKTGNNLENILTTLGTIVGVLIGGKIISSLGTILTSLQSIGGVVASIGAVPALIVAGIALIGVALTDLFLNGSKEGEQWINYLKNIWETSFIPAIESLKPILQSVFETLKIIYEDVVKPIASVIGDALVYFIIPAIGSILNLATSIASVLMPIIQFLVGTSAPVIEIILAGVKGILKVVEMISNLAFIMINGIAEGIKGFANIFIDGLNYIIRALNKLQWTAPDFLGGWKIGFDFAEIPKFANGNVATTPTLGMFGEYSNAKNDPEITSPRSIMADTFAETILPLVNAILKGDEQVVKAIKSQNLTLNVNGTKLAEATLDNYESVAIRRGKILFGK